MNRTNTFSRFGMALGLAAVFAFAHSAAAQVLYTWTNTVPANWSSPSSWSPGTSAAGPTAIDTALFGNAGESTSPSTVNNTVDSGYAGTVANLVFNDNEPSGSYVYPVTSIPTGGMLTVTNLFLVGTNNDPSGSTYGTFALFQGAGTLNVSAPNLIVENYNSGSSGAFAAAYLDLSALTNFVYRSTNGTICVSGNTPAGYASGSFGTRQEGTIVLASGSNNITAGTINLGTAAVAQGEGNNAGPNGYTQDEVTLGGGTNLINVATFNIGAQKNTFTVQASGGGLRIRGLTGANSDSSDNITIGNKNVAGGTGNAGGNLLLNGCAVDIKAGTLIVGENINSQPSSANDAGIGVLQFDTGTISANTVIMADDSSANNGTHLATCSGTIQVGPNATLLIGAGQVFDLASETNNGPSTGNLIISNGLVNCQGPISMGPNFGGTSSGTITFLNGGTLSMGPNSYIGQFTNPITSLNMATGTLVSISIPSTAYTNICSENVNWPSPDSGVTVSVAAMPTGINPGAVFPMLYTTNFVGTFVSPNLSLPAGVQGFLSQSTVGTTNTIYMTITAGVGPGSGGADLLINSNFAFVPLGAFWTASGAASVVSTNSTYPNTSSCTHDTRNIVPLIGTNVARLTGSNTAGDNTNTWSQNVPLAAGTQVTVGGRTYVAHEDMMSGADSFYYEIDFLGSTGNLVAAYESAIVSNLTCGEVSPFALDTWNLMAATNQMQITGGVNTGVIVGSVPSTIIAPPGTVSATYKAVFIQRNAADTGSVYFSGANVGYLLGPVPPVVGSITPNLVTLSTNQFLTCTVSSAITTISGIQLTATTTALAGSSTNTTVYTPGSAGLTVTGLGTPSVNISLALAANTIYQSVIITATDADNVAIPPTTASFDTLTPNLVIEASDFNFTSNGTSGLFFDTPANGGLALYTNQVGMQGIDENKNTRTNFQSYYRPLDATVIQAANPAAPSGTEQKFVTALANGDTNDIEVAVAFDTVGDWQDYSRTFGTSGTFSAQPGTYNVWCYLATSGSGAQVSLFQVTSSPSAPNQTTNFIGNFGGTSFSDNGFNNFVYAPLVDQFGNRVTLTITNGVQTFRTQIANTDTPNVGFYMLVPVVPVLTPVFLNVAPNHTFEPANLFTFSVGPAQGTSISTNGIGLVINGVTITSGLTFTALSGGGWTVDYTIQSNEMYSVSINVTNASGLTASYTGSFDTFNINNYHWMAVDYDFSTNNGTGTFANNGDDGTGGSVGDGWTGGLFIDNPVPTGDSGAFADDQTYQFSTNSYFGYPTGVYPGLDTLSGLGAVAQQGIDINWATNLSQDPGLIISNSVYRFASNQTTGDGVGTQVAADSFLLPEFLVAKTNTFTGRDGTTSGGPDTNICEFNVGYFYAGNWLNYTRTYPAGTFNIWGRLAAGGGAFTNCTLSLVTAGVGTSNQTTQVLGTFSDSAPVGWQTYHWIQLVDANGNPVYLQLSGKETLRLTAPATATSGGNALNPLFFMLAPAVQPALVFNISASLVGGSIQISIPTQSGHNYTLWHAATLTSAWTQVGGSITGNGSVQTIPEPASSAQGFYRVQAQ